jgi:hypothetical protein
VALRGLLSDLAETMGHIHSLQSFVTSVLRGPVAGGQPVARTLEAYASGLLNVLAVFSADLLELEEQVAGQATTATLLGLLFSKELVEWRRRLSYLSQLHQLAVPCYTDDTAAAPNWFAAVRLLSVLYNALTGVLFPELMPCLLDLLLRSFRPYFRKIGSLVLFVYCHFFNILLRRNRTYLYLRKALIFR